MSKNLVKQIFTVTPPEEEKIIIDSNALVRKRLEELARRSGKSVSGGFVSGLGNLEVIEVSENDEDGEETSLIKADQEAEDILAKARSEAEEILAKAGSEAESIVREAKTQADSQKGQILEQAREQGYQDGLVQAKAHEDAMEQEYLEKQQELEDEYQRQVDVLEPLFVDTITGIYEHIFHVELSSYREVLGALISDTIRKQEGSRKFMIHVSKEDYSYVNMQKKQLLAGAVAESVDVIEDMTLDKNECMIETENGIFDCGLGTQLEELRRRLMLLAWSRDEEIS